MEEHALGHWAYEWLINKGLTQDTTSYIILSIDILLVLVVSLLADFIARRLILVFGAPFTGHHHLVQHSLDF